MKSSACGLVVQLPDVECIVIDPARMETHKTPPTASGRYQLVRVFRDETGVEVWRIER